jgi:hypothetical protein
MFMQQFSQQPQQQPFTGMQQTPLRIQEPKMYQQGFSQQVMPQTTMYNADTQLMLTRAGVSNFAQQMQQVGQQLQYLMERLHFAQNQVQTQAEAQLRELQQIQQAIVMTVQQLQQAEIYANMQPNLMQ